MPIETLAIIGAGGHAAVVMDAARLQGATGLAVFSEAAAQAGTIFQGHSVRLLPPAIVGNYHIAIGNNDVRARLHRQLLEQGSEALTIIHPAAVIASGAEIGAGCFIAAGAILAPGSRLGECAIINHRAVVDHDVTVGNYSHIAPGAILGGGVSIGERVLVGAGATVLPSVSIGDGAVIGAGAVVLENVPHGATVVGVPARQI